MKAARRLPAAERPAIKDAIAARPAALGTARACRKPTPSSRKEAYSSAVNTGATYTGFHLSVTHWPQRALLRALCVQAPSSCQTTPTLDVGGSDVSHSVRSVAPESRIRRAQAKKRRFVTSGLPPPHGKHAGIPIGNVARLEPV